MQKKNWCPTFLQNWDWWRILFERVKVLGSWETVASQEPFTCSKSTKETLGKGVNDVVLVFLLLTMNILHTFFQCFYCWIWQGNCLLALHEIMVNTIQALTFYLESKLLILIRIRKFQSLRQCWYKYLSENSVVEFSYKKNRV